MAPRPKRREWTSEQQAEFGRLAQTPGWRIVSQSELPKVFPEVFRAEIDSALIIAAPTPTGGTYLVMSAVRVDLKAQALDQEPFGLIVHSTGAGSSGTFLHHGSWEGRTTQAPPQFWDEVSRSGIGDYFFAKPLSGLREGKLEQLSQGYRNAFEAVIYHIRMRVDSVS